MRQAGAASWRIELDEPEPLVIGLFVRDAAGLRSRHTWLPRCAPAVPRANGEGSEEAAHQWDLWWDRSLPNDWSAPDLSQERLAAMWWLPPDFESLQSAPALQEVVADLGRDLGRSVDPFQLRITEIPVAGKGLWQLDPHHVLLTAELLRDSGEYRRRITPALLALL